MSPLPYRCSVCDASGVKLWRLYQTFYEHQKLFCAACALVDQRVDGEVDAEGYRESEHGKIDQIGWLVPAVPTEDGSTFWGYTSVPEDGVAWWRQLPTRISADVKPADCKHSTYEWPAPLSTREWRVAEEQGRLPIKVQWCPLCGAIREIKGTLIGVWTLPRSTSP